MPSDEISSTSGVRVYKRGMLDAFTDVNDTIGYEVFSSGIIASGNIVMVDPLFTNNTITYLKTQDGLIIQSPHRKWLDSIKSVQLGDISFDRTLTYHNDIAYECVDSEVLKYSEAYNGLLIPYFVLDISGVTNQRYDVRCLSILYNEVSCPSLEMTGMPVYEQMSVTLQDNGIKVEAAETVFSKMIKIDFIRQGNVVASYPIGDAIENGEGFRVFSRTYLDAATNNKESLDYEIFSSDTKLSRGSLQMEDPLFSNNTITYLKTRDGLVIQSPHRKWLDSIKTVQLGDITFNRELVYSNDIAYDCRDSMQLKYSSTYDGLLIPYFVLTISGVANQTYDVRCLSILYNEVSCPSLEMTGMPVYEQMSVTLQDNGIKVEAAGSVFAKMVRIHFIRQGEIIASYPVEDAIESGEGYKIFPRAYLDAATNNKESLDYEIFSSTTKLSRGSLQMIDPSFEGITIEYVKTNNGLVIISNNANWLDSITTVLLDDISFNRRLLYDNGIVYGYNDTNELQYSESHGGLLIPMQKIAEKGILNKLYAVHCLSFKYNEISCPSLVMDGLRVDPAVRMENYQVSMIRAFSELDWASQVTEIQLTNREHSYIFTANQGLVGSNNDIFLSPDLLREVVSGEYTITIKANGFFDASQQITFVVGKKALSHSIDNSNRVLKITGDVEWRSSINRVYLISDGSVFDLDRNKFTISSEDLSIQHSFIENHALDGAYNKVKVTAEGYQEYWFDITPLVVSTGVKEAPLFNIEYDKGFIRLTSDDLDWISSIDSISNNITSNVYQVSPGMKQYIDIPNDFIMTNLANKHGELYINASLYTTTIVDTRYLAIDGGNRINLSSTVDVREEYDVIVLEFIDATVANKCDFVALYGDTNFTEILVNDYHREGNKIKINKSELFATRYFDVKISFMDTYNNIYKPIDIVKDSTVSLQETRQGIMICSSDAQFLSSVYEVKFNDKSFKKNVVMNNNMVVSSSNSEELSYNPSTQSLFIPRSVLYDAQVTRGKQYVTFSTIGGCNLNNFVTDLNSMPGIVDHPIIYLENNEIIIKTADKQWANTINTVELKGKNNYFFRDGTYFNPYGDAVLSRSLLQNVEAGYYELVLSSDVYYPFHEKVLYQPDVNFVEMKPFPELTITNENNHVVIQSNDISFLRNINIVSFYDNETKYEYHVGQNDFKDNKVEIVANSSFYNGNYNNVSIQANGYGDKRVDTYGYITERYFTLGTVFSVTNGFKQCPRYEITTIDEGVIIYSDNTEWLNGLNKISYMDSSNNQIERVIPSSDHLDSGVLIRYQQDSNTIVDFSNFITLFSTGYVPGTLDLSLIDVSNSLRLNSSVDYELRQNYLVLEWSTMEEKDLVSTISVNTDNSEFAKVIDLQFVKTVKPNRSNPLAYYIPTHLLGGATLNKINVAYTSRYKPKELTMNEAIDVSGYKNLQFTSSFTPEFKLFKSTPWLPGSFTEYKVLDADGATILGPNLIGESELDYRGNELFIASSLYPYYINVSKIVLMNGVGESVIDIPTLPDNITIDIVNRFTSLDVDSFVKLPFKVTAPTEQLKEYKVEVTPQYGGVYVDRDELVVSPNACVGKYTIYAISVFNPKVRVGFVFDVLNREFYQGTLTHEIKSDVIQFNAENAPSNLFSELNSVEIRTIEDEVIKKITSYTTQGSKIDINKSEFSSLPYGKSYKIVFDTALYRPFEAIYSRINEGVVDFSLVESNDGLLILSDNKQWLRSINGFDFFINNVRKGNIECAINPPSHDNDYTVSTNWSTTPLSFVNDTTLLIPKSVLSEKNITNGSYDVVVYSNSYTSKETKKYLHRDNPVQLNLEVVWTSPVKRFVAGRMFDKNKISVSLLQESTLLETGKGFMVSETSTLTVGEKDITICSSTACKVFPIKVNSLGDCDGNYDINVSDIVMISQYILGNNMSEETEVFGDINGDNEIRITDLVAVANHILGVKNIVSQ